MKEIEAQKPQFFLPHGKQAALVTHILEMEWKKLLVHTG